MKHSRPQKVEVKSKKLICEESSFCRRMESIIKSNVDNPTTQSFPMTTFTAPRNFNYIINYSPNLIPLPPSRKISSSIAVRADTTKRFFEPNFASHPFPILPAGAKNAPERQLPCYAPRPSTIRTTGRISWRPFSTPRQNADIGVTCSSPCCPSGSFRTTTAVGPQDPLPHPRE